MLLPIIALLVFSAKALAINVLACEGKSSIMAPGKTMHMRLILDENSKEFEVYANGIKSEDKITLYTPKLENVEAFLKCDSYDEPCRSQHQGKDEGYIEAAGVIALAKTLAKEMPKLKHSSLAKLNPKDLAKARIYQMGKTSKFGGMGIYEYFDKSDRMVGRYIFALETMDCRDKVKPTDDQALAMKKLLNGTSKPAPPARTSR